MVHPVSYDVCSLGLIPVFKLFFFVGEDYDVTQSAQFEVMDVEAVDLSHLGTLNSTVGQ